MSDPELVEAIEEHPDRVVTAVDLAEVVDLTGTGVLQRLHDLEDRGVVERKTVGARAVIWWVADDYDSESASLPSSESQ